MSLDALHGVMLAITVWIVTLELTPRVLNDFFARKLCHAGCGLGMLFLDSARLDCQAFVWAISAGSILMTWNMSPLPPFRFARPRDVGITVYLLLVSGWFAVQLPPRILGGNQRLNPGPRAIDTLPNAVRVGSATCQPRSSSPTRLGPSWASSARSALARN